MKNLKKIPTFKNIKEEALFWDTNDIGDFMGELHVVTGAYVGSDEKKTTMTIRLTPSLKKKLDHVASAYDISTSSLVRMWMVDKLQGFTT
jgi:hypothetical protein